MRRVIIKGGILVLVFVTGIVTTTLWNSYFPSMKLLKVEGTEELERPLTTDAVTSALQTHGFVSREIKKNSAHDIEWRWLSKAIAAYPQKTIDVSDEKGYWVRIYTPIILDDMQFDWYNEKLLRDGMPPLHRNTRYLPINLSPADNPCPYWGGLIDLENLNLAYFANRALLVTQYPTFGLNCRDSETKLLATNKLPVTRD